MVILNSLLLVATIVYAVRYGVGNTVKRILSFILSLKLKQSDLGRTLDVLFYISLIYFASFGREYLNNTTELFLNYLGVL